MSLHYVGKLITLVIKTRAVHLIITRRGPSHALSNLYHATRKLAADASGSEVSSFHRLMPLLRSPDDRQSSLRGCRRISGDTAGYKHLSRRKPLVCRESLTCHARVHRTLQ
jgi:hypothetical protein